MSTSEAECRLTRCPECGEVAVDPMSDVCQECGADVTKECDETK